MKIIKRKIKKLFHRIGQFLIFKTKPDSPFGEKIFASEDEYMNLYDEARSKTYPEVNKYQNLTGFKLDDDWVNELALHTQIVKKQSTLNYAHGKILYSALRSYLAHEDSTIEGSSINIIETGTARGFSALCMAKAAHDSEISGSIITFDLIPNQTKMYWNCIDDHESKKTRLELLNKWSSLVSKYIIFVEGDTRTTLRDISVSRVNFAFLDGAHTYEDVMFEFSTISDKQLSGDMIVYDDYNAESFPGIVRAVDEICSNHGYSKTVITADDNRAYVIAKKMISDVEQSQY